MASWTSASLLTRFNQWAARPTTDAITSAEKYQRLADAQDAVLTEIATVAAKVLYAAPFALTTSDGGYTFTFGSDGSSNANFMIGMTSIYPNLNAVPDYPWVPGVDYLDEGTRIRMPNNVPWSGSLYAYGLTMPAAISASQEPFIQPPQSRVLIVIRAVQSFAEEGNRNPALADRMAARWAREWPKNAVMIRKHFRGPRALGPLVGFTRLGGGVGYSGGITW